MTTDIIPISGDEMLPPILAGQFTPATKQRVGKFYSSIAEIFEAWVTRRQSPHTQRAYREDFMTFVNFIGIRWPEEAWKIVTVSIKDVQAFRDQLIAEDKAPIRLHEKGDKRRTIGLHYAAAHAISEYIEKAAITAGPLFRPRLNPRSQKLSDRAMNPVTMYLLIQSYLERLPGAMKEVEQPDGTTLPHCIYTPHSVRATTATLLLDAGVDIRKVQDLLGHRPITPTQLYDKRRRSTSESASHDEPI